MIRLRNLLLTLVMAAVAPAAADASLIMSLTPSGPSSVTLSYSGFINTTTPGFISTGGTLATTSMIQPNAGLIQNNSSVSLFVTGSSAGAQNFGTGGTATATSSSGSPIYVSFAAPSLLGLPTGYTSGSPISGSMTFSGTIASLGMIDNQTYTFSWAGGGPGSSISFTVTSVPEPATMGILAVGSVVGGYTYRRRAKRLKIQSIPK